MSARRRLVVATDTTQPDEHNERLLTLVAWFREHGVEVEVVALGDGWARDRFRAVAPLLVVDELRRRGPARPFWMLGLDPLPNAVKAFRLRRWLASRSDRPFLVVHPLAAGVLRYARTPPRRVVASLPGPDWSLDQLRDADRETLSTAAAWIVRTQEQRGEVAAASDAPVVVLDALVDPRTLVPVVPRPADGAVVLLTASDRWATADFAVEVTWQLHRADRDLRFRWVVQDPQSAWLARHDVAEAGLGGVTTVVREDRPDVLDGVASVVRASEDSTGSPLAVAAAIAGVPVLGWGVEHVTGGASAPAADVEAVVDAVLACRSRPAGAVEVGSLSHLNLDHRGTELLGLLFPDDDAGPA